MSNALLWNTARISLVAIVTLMILFIGIRIGYPKETQGLADETPEAQCL
jgi:hypothetical protein